MKASATLLLAAVASISLASPSQAWEADTKWPQSTVLLTLNASDFPANSAINLELQSAMASWNKVPGSSFEFRFNTAPCDANNSNDKINCVTLAPESNFEKGIPAYTGTRATGGVTSEVSVRFINTKDWMKFDNSLGETVLRNIARHEFGHVIGLCHDTRDTRVGVMGEANSQGRIHADDRAALRSLYPGSGTETDIAPILDKNPANGGVVCIYTGPQAGGPDEVADPIVLPVPAAFPGESFVTEYAIESLGNRATGLFDIAFLLSTDANLDTRTDRLLATRADVSLAAHEYRLDTQALTIPADTPPGRYFVGYCVDSGNDVVESSGTNNCAVIRAGGCIAGTDCALPVILPDFEATDLSVVSPGAILPGQQIKVSTTIRNRGDEYTREPPPFAFGVFLQTSYPCGVGDRLLGYKQEYWWFSGGMISPQLSLTIPSDLRPGSYTLCTVADHWSLIPESREDNNVISTNIRVLDPSSPPGVDLVSTIGTMPSTITVGKSFNVSFGVSNRGLTAAPATELGVYLSPDPTCSVLDLRIGTERIPGLAPGTAYGFDDYFIVNESLPEYDLFCLIADRLDQVAESNESNNVASRAVTVSRAPDDILGIDGFYREEGGLGPDTFSFTNTGTKRISKLILSAALDPDVVFDVPFALSSAGNTGFNGTFSLDAARQTVTLNFSNFDPGETLTFTVDVDDAAGGTSYTTGSEFANTTVILNDRLWGAFVVDSGNANRANVSAREE